MSITLSTGIPAWFVDQFTSGLYHVCQQKDSKFGSAVRTEPVLNAEDKAFDMMGSLSLVEKTGRNPQTPTTDVTTGRRWITTTPYHNAWLYDKDDDLQMILDPTSDIQTAFVRAVNRKKDDIILAAFDATVQSGRRYGDSTITWASALGTTKYTNTSGGRTIPWDCAEGNCAAGDTGMTVEKIELIKEYFALNDADDETTPLWCAINPRQATQLFGQMEYTNSDYTEGRPLATGRIMKNWHGVNWIISNKIVSGTSNDVDADSDVYRCPAWLQDGIILGIADAISTKISDRPDLSHAQQVYVHMNMGAMRMDEDRVLFIECKK